MTDIVASFFPCRLIEYSHLPFCPDNTVSKGITPIDTFSKMLGTVKGVTPAMTIAVTKEYGTFRSLMEEYDRLEFKGGTEEQANHLLKDLVVRPFPLLVLHSGWSDFSCCRSPPTGRAPSRRRAQSTLHQQSQVGAD
jgi:hypothetical protein